MIIRNVFSRTKERRTDWDSIVLSLGRVPNGELYEQVKPLAQQVFQIGDCLARRTIEEATYEGLFTALHIGVKEPGEMISTMV